MTEIAKLSLPCSVAALERAILRAAHQGRWHVAEVNVKDGNELVIYYDESAAKQPK